MARGEGETDVRTQVEVVSLEKIIYRQPRAGITELSKKFAEEHLPKIGTVSEVFCYINSDGDSITIIRGSEGTIIVDGFTWGYGGEGPHGLLWLLSGKLGIATSIREIAGLDSKGPHIWKTLQ